MSRHTNVLESFKESMDKTAAVETAQSAEGATGDKAKAQPGDTKDEAAKNS